jgi:hypothetical protein
MTFWKHPPRIKIYEALGAIGDRRILVNGNEAKVYSSARTKRYTVSYDPEHQAIMCNDNASYWQDYLGYPGIAYLLEKGILLHHHKFAIALKGIVWHELSTQMHGDHDKMERYVVELCSKKGISHNDLLDEIQMISEQLQHMQLSLLGKKVPPPKE